MFEWLGKNAKLKESWIGKIASAILPYIWQLSFPEDMSPEVSLGMAITGITAAQGIHTYNRRKQNQTVIEQAPPPKAVAVVETEVSYPKYGTPEFAEYYGSIENVPLKKIELPYEHKLAWGDRQKITHVSCHEKIADQYVSVLRDTLAHYGIDRIKELGLDVFGGCYSKRKMRGGSKWSTHAWAIAFDYDPENNQLKWDHTKATFAAPEYAEWINIWEAHGAISLGRYKDYDWMHFQFCEV